MAHAQPHQHPVKAEEVPNIESLSEHAADVVSEAATIAQARGRKAGTRLQEVVRAHPVLSLGITLGSGVLLGAVGHRLLEHKPTLGEVIAEGVGMNRLRKRIRHWL
ncbi:MAG: hypothetical protein Q8L48_38720 [Archangium sp.]|nr:hypothetical protein [Archangium sp.]